MSSVGVKELEVKPLEEKDFLEFLRGKMRDEYKTVVDVIILLELMRPQEQMFFLPGYMTMHSTMLDMLKASVKDVGFAGRAHVFRENTQLVLDPGGSSMRGYSLNRLDETMSTFKKILDKRKLKNWNVVWR